MSTLIAPSAALDPAPAPTLERRRQIRYQMLQRCFVRRDGTASTDGWRCIAYNLSRTGVGVTLPCPLAVGTIIGITPWNLPRAKSLLVRVVRLTQADFVWFAGCELAEPLADDELATWLAGPLD